MQQTTPKVHAGKKTKISGGVPENIKEAKSQHLTECEAPLRQQVGCPVDLVHTLVWSQGKTM